MEKTGSNLAGNLRWSLIAGVVVIAVVVGGYQISRGLLTHRQARHEARKEAFFRADKLSLYSEVEFLEQQRSQSIAGLIAGVRGQSNVNAALVQLLATSHMYSSVPVSNFAGLDLFVDPWGLPLQFTVVTNAGVPRAVSRHIENRLIVEKGHRP